MPKPQIKIGALIPYPINIAPGQRYRIEQWAHHLGEVGIEVEMLPFATDELMQLLHQPGKQIAKAFALAKCFARRAWLLTKLQRYDAIYLFRTASIVGPAVLERFLSMLGRPVIFDFDDAIYLLHTTAANRYFGWLKFPGKTATICGLSSHVVVGNSYLADYARQFNSQVSIIPSSVDVDRYQASSEARNPDRRIVVGWTGSSTSQTHLEWFTPVLWGLAAQREVEIRVISDREPVLPGVPYVWQGWSAASEVADMQPFDIGIMPMPDDQWARGKCSMKALLYMALGIPTICSAIGMNCEVIQHGENGLLARTNEEWLDGLKALIDDAALRQRLGAAGRRTIENQYSMRQCAAQFAKVVQEVMAIHNTQKETKRWFLQKSKSSAQ
jgi:glycosyltransferase involved in cell wall biosynthesis